MEQETLEKVAQRYRDEGYDVIIHPRREQAPPFLADLQLDMVATRGNEGVVVEIKPRRIDLSKDPQIAYMASVVNAQAGWKFDLVILEPETTVEKAASDAAEPSDEQLFQILQTADELAERGYAPFACVGAWGGLEAAMRRLREDTELYGRTTPTELMRTLYSNGFLSREQFERLREAYKVRSQVVHGLVPAKITPDLVRYITATARHLVTDEGAALSPC